MNGQPLDPLLADVYKQWGEARFATERVGLMIAAFDDGEDFSVVVENLRWRRLLQRMARPLVIFAGEPLSAYRYATVPALADAQGHQPVVFVDLHEEPHALPVASSVDQFLDLYARFLEELVASSDGDEGWGETLAFPYDLPHLFAQDRQLVQMIRTGEFDSLMKMTNSTSDWIASVMEAADGLVH